MSDIFPKHDIDPAKKTDEWGLKAAKAIWSESEGSPQKMFYKNREQYDIIRSYVLGKQDTTKYKVLLLGSEKCNDPESLLAIDWTPRPIAAKLRDIGISKILERGYNFGCYPIDPLAKDETDKYYADARVKIMMREAALAVNPELAQNPAFMKEHGEPEDMAELEMSMNYGPKLKMAMEAEMAIQLVMYKNDYDEIRKVNAENLWDFGVAGAIEYIDENGDVRIREANIDNVVMSSCRKADFSDKTYFGEVIEVNLSKLASKFSSEQMREISNKATNKNVSPITPTQFNNEFDPFKVDVLDFKLYSWNETQFQQRVDKRGNLVVRKEEYSEKNKNDKKIIHDGVELPQYKTKKREVVYQGKWIIGTDFIYDFGLATSIRSKSNRAAADMGCHFHASNYSKGDTLSMMQRVITIIDDYQMTIYKIQNFKNKWIPYIIDIDIEALENVALGKGGAPMKPKDLINMVYQNFTLVRRKTDSSTGQGGDNKAVDVRPTGMAQEFTVLRGEVAHLLGEMSDIVGLNEVTDGSSPNPNMLNYVASLGADATNNALRPIMTSDKKIGEATAKGVIQKTCKVIKNKKVEGFLPALGSESMRFISISEDIALQDWGIMVENRPTKAERELFMQQLNMKDANGQVEPEDYLMVMETQNLKQARQLFAYRAKKRKKEAQDYELQKMKMNGQVQQDSGIAVEKSKQETLALEYQLKGQLELQLKQMDMEMLKLKLAGAKDVADTNADGKAMTQVIANDGKAEQKKEK